MPTVTFAKHPQVPYIVATVGGYAASAIIRASYKAGRKAIAWRVKWYTRGAHDGECVTFRTKREAKAHVQARFDLWETNRAASGAMLGR